VNDEEEKMKGTMDKKNGGRRGDYLH